MNESSGNRMRSTAHGLRPDPRWPALAPSLAEIVVTAGDPAYAHARSNYMRIGSPTAVFQPATEEGVRSAVMYAAEVRRLTGERVPLSVRSGGHGISGASTNDGGIVIDLSKLSGFEELAPSASLVRVGAGSTWGQVSARLAPHGRALTSGNVGPTGVGGIATSGGIGYFARSQGLTLDHVRRVRVVTADGGIRWVDDEQDPELFWALRGGATHAGIAVDFILDAPMIGSGAPGAPILHQEVEYAVDDLSGFVERWGSWINGAPREAESFLMMQAMGDGRTWVRAQNVWANDDTATARPVLESALALGRVLDHHTVALPYPRLVPHRGGSHTRQQPLEMRAALIDRADRALGEAMSSALVHRATMLGEIRALGGAVSDVPAGATAWAGRHQEAFAATWIHPLGTDAADESFAALRESSTGSYGAYSTDTRPTEAARAWPGATGERLGRTADQVDPERLFDRGLVLPRSDDRALM
ncbi:FAD-binding oxidoreductase [Agromyces italicus]|uniref:FAD-binding oxidoreductase n=1 Tax=Agromyces italicus TaxID=279572 RepID=UPI0003B6A647|nr:FAD-dependent oxidoreductase [Agromyces italicus]